MRCPSVLSHTPPRMNDGCHFTAEQSKSEVAVEPQRDAVAKIQTWNELN